MRRNYNIKSKKPFKPTRAIGPSLGPAHPSNHYHCKDHPYKLSLADQQKVDQLEEQQKNPDKKRDSSNDPKFIAKHLSLIHI